MTYHLGFDIVAFIILATLTLFFCNNRRNILPAYWLFCVMASVCLGMTIFDIASVVIMRHPEYYPISVHYMVNILYLFTQNIIPMLYTAFIIRYADIKMPKAKRATFVWVPATISTLLVFAAPLNGWIFYIDENYIYRHGPLFPALYAIALYYLIYDIVLLRYHKIDRKKVKSIFMFWTIAIAAIVAQALIDGYLVCCFGISLVMSMIIYGIQSPDEIFDHTNSVRKTVFFDIARTYYDREEKFHLISVTIQDYDMLCKTVGEDFTTLILRSVSDFLFSLQRRKSVVFRASNNTLVLKVSRLSDKAADEMVEKIRERFKSAWKLHDASTVLSANFVVVKCPDDAATVSEMIDVVNIINTTVSKSGTILHARDFKNIKRNRDILNAVITATTENKFQVYYQPIYSTEKKKIVAAEALIRLIDDKLGFVPPDIFIPIAEKEGYILRIGKFVFEEVCRFYSENKLEEKGIEYIEVNLSVVQCMQYRFAEEFIEIMNKYGIKPSQINFEITETSATTSYNAMIRNLNVFNDNGVSLSLDDYGTGYSNISYIYTLPFDRIKVDKCILWSADSNPKAYVTLKNTFQMAKKLNMSLVMEGVETEEQVRRLLDLQCDYFQGYFFSKAVNGGEFIKYIEEFSLPDVCK